MRPDVFKRVTPPPTWLSSTYIYAMYLDSPIWKDDVANGEILTHPLQRDIFEFCLQYLLGLLHRTQILQRKRYHEF